MIDLTVLLHAEVDEDVKKDIEERLTSALLDVFSKGVKVHVSKCRTNKPAELLFTDMSPVELDDVEEIADAALTALIFSDNSLEGKKISITIHPTIIYEVRGDIR